MMEEVKSRFHFFPVPAVKDDTPIPTVEVLTIRKADFSKISAAFPAPEADAAVIIIRISSPALIRDIPGSLLLRVPLRRVQTAARRFLPDPISGGGQ